MLWDNEKFKSELRTRRFGHEVVFFEEIDSTNRWLLENEDRFNLIGSTVIANHQKSGRGRRGRHWYDVPGKSLLFSVLLRPDKKNAPLGFLPLMAGVAVAEALCQFCGCSSQRLRLKWPNDILIDNHKVSGILAENTSAVERLCIVIGIGVNLYQGTEELPDENRHPASSLDLLSLAPSSREGLLARILEELEILYDLFRECNIEEMTRRWSFFSTALDSPIAVERSEGIIHGIYKRIGEQGQLVLKNPNGFIQEIYSGEILPEGQYE